MLHKVSVFAVQEEKLWFNQIHHQFQLFLPGMSGDVDACCTLVNNMCALFEEMINRPGNQFLCTENRRRRDNYGVTRHNRNFTVFPIAIRESADKGSP